MNWRDLFRIKPLDRLIHEAENPQKQLKRALGPVHLTFIGIGAIIGAGVFSMVGEAVAETAATSTTAARAGASPPPGPFLRSGGRGLQFSRLMPCRICALYAI
jgi:hypothetical protein